MNYRHKNALPTKTSSMDQTALSHFASEILDQNYTQVKLAATVRSSLRQLKI